MIPRALEQPRIPAKAGTQIIWRAPVRYGAGLRFDMTARRLSIWVPAFAGMSGVEMQSLGKA